MYRIVVLVFFMFAAGYARSAAAQIKETSPAKLRAANRRSLRESRQYPAPAAYKDSHLAVSRTDLRRGEGGQAGQPHDGRDSYKFDKTGTARVSEPIAPGLRPRKKKKE
ncbi:hypothetical protein [Hymenobacter crusticola]|uniref:Bacterial toxin 24 domain-containing protein n=1 Tax=Hymenobacter crusticola TaxID=1770526 RepID=A0A243WJ77_9BACT|nr:hypothetical protein [Hymenobacter crusticola]OUJ75945.1 hypothetical protein BXP70_01265 [Hymenobacter crusticola]